MPNDTAIKQRTIDWAPIRKAFVEESPRPTFAELSGRFSVPISTLSTCARDELWPDMRAEYYEQRLKEAGASELILSALKGEGEILKLARAFIAKFITTGEVLLEAIHSDETGKPSTRVSNLNNLGFAFANIGRFTESIGAVGMPKDLRNAKNAGQGENGQPWEKGMLQQINVTVKNIQAEGERLAKVEAVTVDPAKPSGPADGF